MSDSEFLLPEVADRIVENHAERQTGWVVVVDDPHEDGDRYAVGPFLTEDAVAQFVSGVLIMITDDGGTCEVLPFERPMNDEDIEKVFNRPA